MKLDSFVLKLVHVLVANKWANFLASAASVYSKPKEAENRSYSPSGLELLNAANQRCSKYKG